MASLETFLGLDVRIGTIVSAEPLKGAQRPALALRITFGPLGTKLAGAELTDLYEPADLVGLQVAGLVCEVVVLTADNGRGEMALLIPERPVPDGGQVVR